MKELDGVVLQLVDQCRCEACFECLERAGLVESWWSHGAKGQVHADL